jgi:hypothetical protein
MTTLQEFRCEVCGLVTNHPARWFVIRCASGNSDWNFQKPTIDGFRVSFSE